LRRPCAGSAYHVIATDLSLAHKLDLSDFGREIVRVGNVLERLGKKFIDRVADNAAKGFVDPEPSAVGSGVRDADRRVLERGPEPGLALGESVPGFDLLSNNLAEHQHPPDPAIGGVPRLG
jgi:hypothetical protein